jgi:hypothetical protein
VIRVSLALGANIGSHAAVFDDWRARIAATRHNARSGLAGRRRGGRRAWSATNAVVVPISIRGRSGVQADEPALAVIVVVTDVANVSSVLVVAFVVPMFTAGQGND